MNKKSQVSIGLIIRFIGMIFIIFSLSFLILNPQNPIALIVYAFGNLVLVIGGSTD